MVSIPAEQIPPLMERMIRIEAKLDTFNSNHQDHEGRLRVLETIAATHPHIEARLESGMSTFADHESRLRSLERRMWVTAGVAVLGGIIAGSVVGPALGIGG